MDESSQAEAEAAALIEKVRAMRRPLTEDERRTVAERAQALRPIIAARHARDLVENRSEVITHGSPVASGNARRGQEEARRRLADRVAVHGRDCVRCPAATAVRDGASLVVICGVEHSELSSSTDPQSLLTFCAGDYVSCPSWKAEREGLRAGRRSLVEA